VKRIILDYYRRWWLGVLAILIAHFFLERYSLKQSAASEMLLKIFSCQILMFLGFILVGDLVRGQGRVLATLPVTARQAGRALWIASVLIPGIALAAISVTSLLLFSNSFAEIWAAGHLIHWILPPVVLGATFGSFTLKPTTITSKFAAAVRGATAPLTFFFPLAAWFYLQDRNIAPVAASLLISALVFLTVLGWVRAGRMVSAAPALRFASASQSKLVPSPLSVSGFGGMRYLVQRTLVRSVLTGLAIILVFVVVVAFMSGRNQSLNFPATMVGAINGVFTPFFFILMMECTQLAQQIRFLRTLPISPSSLTAILIMLPLVSIAAVGTILAILMITLAGQTTLAPLLHGFVTIAGIAALGVAVVVWRGLDSLTYLLLFLLIAGGPIFSLIMLFAFSINHIPAWISTVLSPVLVALSWVLTRWLVSRSSAAYRVRPSSIYSWTARPS
jgi:hypothetical protein